MHYILWLIERGGSWAGRPENGAKDFSLLITEPYVSLTFQPYVKKNGKRKTL